MSTHDSGRGLKAGPAPELQSDFANRQSAGTAPQNWGANALSTQKSEVAFMVQGAGRPGQPGQRSIFGGNGPVFAQMPSYTPVTRGPAPQAPEPQQPPFTPYVASQQAPQTFQNPFSNQPVQPAPQPAPAPAPSYQSLQSSTAPSYQAADFQPQSYRANQPAGAPSFSNAEHPGAQAYPGSSYNGQGFQGQPYQPQPYPDANFGDASFPETPGQDASYAEPKFAEPSYGKQNYGDASFGDASFEDASFPEPNFPAPSSPFSHLESGLDGGFSGQQPHAQPDHGFDSFTEESAQDYVMGSQGGNSGQVPPSDPRRQLQAFDALYDQPPQIALGSTDPSRHAPQDFYESDHVDADFLDEAQVVPPPGARSKMGTLRSRSAFMVGSALLGAIALGGALAFAYKQSGGGIGSDQPPLVTADNRPVKEVPDEPGGKEFPHKNKLIYDRLQNGDEPESERIVPRQEDVAVPVLPPAPTDTSGLPTPVATTDLVPPPTTQTVDGSAGAAPTAVASADDADGGPRRVKTLKVRPDGSVEDPAGGAAANAAQPAMAQASAADGDTAALPAAAPAPSGAMPVPATASAPAAPQQVAAVPPPPVKPKTPKPAATQASVTPQAGAAPAASASTKYVVQVGSKKNQTEALASFADMQQKYPTLLGTYRPMVQKADLGSKGVWYRLRIGPIADKTAAAKLCSQLKAQGLPDCLVATQ
jgi:hypothetical protein